MMPEGDPSSHNSHNLNGRSAPPSAPSSSEAPNSLRLSSMNARDMQSPLANSSWKNPSQQHQHYTNSSEDSHHQHHRGVNDYNMDQQFNNSRQQRYPTDDGGPYNQLSSPTSNFQSIHTHSDTNPNSNYNSYDDESGRQSFSAFHYARATNNNNSNSRDLPLNTTNIDRMRASSLDSNNVIPSPHENIGEQQLQRTQDICTSYLRGQLSNVAKAAVWWSTFGVVAEALTKIPLAVGTTRLVFNLALIISSPLAGTVAENANIQTLLNSTTWGRLIIWCCFIPASWFYFASYLGSFTSFYICFLILMFLDGIQVSFANVVDIDCGGLDTLASQYKLSIGNYLRDRFNRIHQIVFDLSFILLTPPVAFLIWQIAFRFDHRDAGPNNTKHSQSHSSFFSSSSLLPLEFNLQQSDSYEFVSFLEGGGATTDVITSTSTTSTTNTSSTDLTVDAAENLDVAVLMIGICGVFGMLSLYSLWSYWGNLSVKNQRRSPLSDDQEFVTPQSARSDNTVMNEASSSSSASRESNWQLTLDRFRDVKDGFVIVLGERPLGWRLLFLALETALEDAIVSVVIPQLALQMTPLLWTTFYPTPKHLSSPSLSSTTSSLMYSSFLPSPYVLPPILPGGWTFVNFVAVSLIAIGKSGGLASGAYMSSRWTAPPTIEKSGPYSKLFRCMFYSSASLLAFPLAYYILLDPHPFQLLLSDVCSDHTIDIIRGVSSAVLVAIAGFLFFVFSTAPKIGFATLLHSLVVQRDIDPKVFGFVGTFVTITDAVVILALNVVFAFCGPNRFLLALLISSGIYLLHGIAELVLGPRLILERSNDDRIASEEQSVDFPNLFRYNNGQEQSPVVMNDDDDPYSSINSMVQQLDDDRYDNQHRVASGGRVLESSAREFGRHNNNNNNEISSPRDHQLDALQPMVGSWRNDEL